jgi:hypothetical protein
LARGAAWDFLGLGTQGDTAPARNEGVGEHVRTKSQPASSAGEIADLWIRTDEENFFLPPNRPSPERTLSKTTTRPIDLMSRRHPLSSTRAAGLKSALWKRTVLTALVTSPASSRRQFFRRGYFFFL